MTTVCQSQVHSESAIQPFMFVAHLPGTRPHSTVEIEISEDMQLVHFDFNSTPFELHDDAHVLKAMQFCERPCSDVAVDEKRGNHVAFNKNPTSNMQQNSLSSDSTRTIIGDSYSLSSIPGRICTSLPVPGILKARVKNEKFT
eukprot:Gb_36939 [translate_table: standard]